MAPILCHRSFHPTGVYIYRNIFISSEPFATFTSHYNKHQHKVDNYFRRDHVSISRLSTDYRLPNSNILTFEKYENKATSNKEFPVFQNHKLSYDVIFVIVFDAQNQLNSLELVPILRHPLEGLFLKVEHFALI